MEPQRRKSLVEAAIHMIGEQGSLDVPVKQIALRAGMSSGLAFHYFGDKEQIMAEAMRHLLRELGSTLVHLQGNAGTPAARVNAVFEACFGNDQFDKNTVSAWLVFYCHARRSPQLARLYAIYSCRLRSNLLADLKHLQPVQQAEDTTNMLSALIDGLYIQQALNPKGAIPATAIGLCSRLLASRLSLPVSNKEH